MYDSQTNLQAIASWADTLHPQFKPALTQVGYLGPPRYLSSHEISRFLITCLSFG